MTILPLILALVGCSKGTGIPDLKPDSELVQACYGWPDQEFTPKGEHPTGRETRLNTGDAAVDFTLKDLRGNEHQLAEMLKKKPVLLVAGSYTCNVFQRKTKQVKQLAKKYGDEVEVVVVYNVEAHPKGDPSPYKGRPWPMEFSDRGQADTYDERVQNAREVDVGGAMVLIDALEAGNANPFWCTYGSCPNCAFLVNQQGRLEAVHAWFDGKTMGGSIDALLERMKQEG